MSGQPFQCEQKSDLSLEQGHSIIAPTSKPHELVLDQAIQMFALKGLAVGTLRPR